MLTENLPGTLEILEVNIQIDLNEEDYTIRHFIVQLMHKDYKTLKIIKIFKIIKAAPT